jgi:Na+-translocating ferredoxin:NAD+ oxidoreductase RNF subunit RnfB
VITARKENIKKILELLPKRNCGLCGYDNCGQFAKAVAEKKASPFGCGQNPWLGYRLSEIIGVKQSESSYGFQSAFYAKPNNTTDPKVLQKEIQGLFKKADDIMARIENLKAKMVDTQTVKEE